MDSNLSCISPIDGSVFVERPCASGAETDAALDAAVAAARAWRAEPLAQRARLCRTFVERVFADSRRLSLELARQMGRPIAYGPGEIGGFRQRALRMIELADEALADIVTATPPPGRRFIRREPLGVFLTIAPWNYPYLTAVNSIVPALMAGNAVVLKHSHQTPLVAERLVEAAQGVLPDGLFSYLHLGREATARLVGDPRIAGAAFTGSVAGGVDIEQAAAGRFIPVGLELGGKDPAYVRADADVASAVENLVDGAFFNSGQSCCGIERIYVARPLFRDFVEAFRALTLAYRLGDPLDPSTTLGPLVRAQAARFVQGQIDEAVAAGAKALVPRDAFPGVDPASAYLAPQVLVDVDHSMRVMREETFGPVVGIMPVEDDAEALALMNDSDLGLTASLWTRDTDAALALGGELATGTVFLNRCDYLDPDLAWTGAKNSGRGCSLSLLGYGQLTRAKSYNFARAL
ncbi:MAG: aldehyde dehydrogenase family protein [Caulobacteraceae bacterium]|nr:aldehyde dehydrogenase family protein [Caulobacteraceae bacterium]